MDKHRVFIIDEAPLIEAISRYGKGYKSKDYEYAVSIYMKRKLEEIYDTQFSIVFDVKDNNSDIRRTFKPSSEETIQILRNTLREDTPIDFGLVKGTVDNPSKEGFAFQVKKFLAIPSKNINEDLLNYINKILAKYRPGEVSLIVIPSVETDETYPIDLIKLDVEMLRKEIKVPKKSFKGVFIMFYSKGVRIKQLWPPLNT